MADIKWSAFPSIGNLATGDVLVGLRAGANVRFSALTIPWTVPNGGTGIVTATAYALLAGGTTATGAFQSLGTGTSGQLLQSGGPAALPTWTTATFPSGSGTLNHMLRSDGTNWVQTTATTLDASDNFAGITSAAIGNLSLSVNTLSSTNTDGNISFTPNGVGTVTAGSSTLFTGTGAGFFTLEVAKSGAQAFVSVGSFKNNASPSVMGMYKSRSTTVGSHVTVNVADAIGSTQYNADDGTNYVTAAQIDAAVSLAPSTGIVPTILRFWTTNSVGTLTLGMTLNETQALSVVSNITSSTGIIASGTSSGGVVGKFQAFSTGAALGSTSLTAANNAGNFANVLTNASTAAARTWTLPDASGTIALTSGGGLPWSTIAGTTQAAAVNNGYVIGNASQTTVTLPATAAVGSVVAVAGQGAGGFLLAANTGQTIKFAGSTTTSGGSLTSAEQYDYIQVVCIVANTTWLVQSAISTGFTPA